MSEQQSSWRLHVFRRLLAGWRMSGIYRRPLVLWMWESPTTERTRTVPQARSSDDVFEAVGGVAGQPHPFAAAAQVLAVRPLHVDVPLLLLADATSLRAALQTQMCKGMRTFQNKESTGFFTGKLSYLAEDRLHSVGVEPHLTLPAELLVVHLRRITPS